MPNPTEWVDPLGLSTCPGADDCKPTTTEQDSLHATKVDLGEPAVPQPRVTPRQARIEELTEANAKRRILEHEKKYDMHMAGKHGPEVSEAKLRQRSIDGEDPITGRVPMRRGGGVRVRNLKIGNFNYRHGRRQHQDKKEDFLATQVLTTTQTILSA